jgi:RNA polymerase sigma-70 factor (ECF subfamily)
MRERDWQLERRAEFERLALPMAPRLRAAARRWCSHTAAADDAVQEAYLRAYRTFDAFQPGTNAAAWLFTILYSVCANERDHRRIRIAVPLDEGASFPSEPPAEPLAHTETGRALDALEEPFRSAVVLVDVGELSYEEAARAMGCAAGTLRSRLSRGRRALAERLAHLAPRARAPRNA